VLHKDKALPDVPLIMDLTGDALKKAALRLIVSRQSICPAVRGPASHPRGQARLLRAAFDATMKDPEFRRSGKTQSRRGAGQRRRVGRCSGGLRLRPPGREARNRTGARRAMRRRERGHARRSAARGAPPALPRTTQNPGKPGFLRAGSTESGAPRPEPVMRLAYEELPPSEPPPLDDGEDGPEP
jgi:hypothetical protein